MSTGNILGVFNVNFQHIRSAELKQASLVLLFISWFMIQNAAHEL